MHTINKKTITITHTYSIPTELQVLVGGFLFRHWTALDVRNVQVAEPHGQLDRTRLAFRASHHVDIY